MEDYQLKRQIKSLSEEERREILEKSPLEAGAFQGEGFHVFLKSEPDYLLEYEYQLAYRLNFPNRALIYLDRNQMFLDDSSPLKVYFR